MTSLKQFIEKQNSEIQCLQDKNCRLESENKKFADKNIELMKHIKK